MSVPGGEQGGSSGAARRRAVRRYWTGLWLCYVALIVYGSLFPWRGWLRPNTGGWGSTWDGLLAGLSGHISTTDVVSNVLVYLPLGGMWAVRSLGRRRGGWLLVQAALLGTLLSIGMELAQRWMPGRVPSLSDVLANGVGATVGAVLVMVTGTTGGWGARVRHLRQRWGFTDPEADLALAAIGLWAAAQLAPFVPSLDLSNVKAGLRPVERVVRGEVGMEPGHALAYLFAVLVVVALWGLVLANRRQAVGVATAMVAAVLLLKVVVVGRQLSLEALAGASVALGAAAVVVARVAERWRLSRWVWVGVASLAAAYLVAGVRRGTGGALHPMVWIPFGSSNLSLVGLEDTLEGVWWGMALAALVASATPSSHRRTPLWIGGAVAALFALGIELLQRSIPGRYPDVTDACLVVAGWGLAWAWLAAHTVSKSPVDRYAASPRG